MTETVQSFFWLGLFFSGYNNKSNEPQIAYAASEQEQFFNTQQ